MCELRLTLFVIAVQMSTSRPECLLPFPACFFDRKTKTKRFPELQFAIASVPKLEDIKEEMELPDLTWELLYWVFTNPLTIKPIKPDACIDDIKALTKLMDIPQPDNRRNFLFKIQPSYPKEKFATAKAEFGSFYAYHGSKLENFHSIMHRGLVSALNVRSAYGVGTYLSSKLDVSRSYSESRAGWSKSMIGNQIQCIAIVEVINHPSIRNVQINQREQTTYHVVDKDEYLQLSHLLIFNVGYVGVINRY